MNDWWRCGPQISLSLSWHIILGPNSHT